MSAQNEAGTADLTSTIKFFPGEAALLLQRAPPVLRRPESTADQKAELAAGIAPRMPESSCPAGDAAI